MKKFLLSFLCFLLAVAGGYAEEYSYTFTSKQFSANGPKTLNGVVWTLDGDGGYWGSDGTKGQQFGSSGAPYKTMTLSTSGIEGTITKIVINTSGATSIAGSCTVTVGGTQFGSKITLTKTATAYTLEGNASGDIVLSYTQTSSKAIYIKSISITYTTTSEGGGEGGGETPEITTLNTPIINQKSCSFNKSIDITIDSNNDDASVYYTLDGTSPTNNSTLYEGVITLNESATVKAIAVKDGCNNSAITSATYTKNVLTIEGGITDVLTRDVTGVKKDETTYASWLGKKLNSTAVYAGNSAGSNNAIQLRSKDNSGIITTKSGGVIKSIVVEWNSSTADGRTLNIYGKNGEYSSSADLYDNDKSGTKLGTIVKGTSTELFIPSTPFYTFIGMRSSSNAMYINSIKVTWEGEKWGSIYQDKAFEIPEDVEMYIVTSVNGESVHLKKVEGVLPANTGAIYKANYNVVTDCVDDNGTSYNDTNLLKGSVDATNIEGDAYVLAKVDGIVGLYKAALNKDKNGNEGTTHFLNNANKAYLPASAVTSNVKALKFDFDTTGVEVVKVETAGKKVIYDLSGRRVNEMAQPGIYIVNGKKVMVK